MLTRSCDRQHSLDVKYGTGGRVLCGFEEVAALMMRGLRVAMELNVNPANWQTAKWGSAN